MDLVEIGYFSKTHGIKGHLILKSDSEFYFEEVKAFFIDTAGSKAPYFVSETTEGNYGLIILFEDINSIEKAKPLLGKKVFISSEFLAEESVNEDWVGYELIDAGLGSLGTILEVNYTGHQLLVNINYKGKEIILPMVDDFIENIDDVAKKIFFKSPEGLIDIYLAEK